MEIKINLHGSEAIARKNAKLQTTTGNVYGIYDMSGGLEEAVAVYLDNEKNVIKAKEMINDEGSNNTKYKTKYEVGISDTSEQNFIKNMEKGFYNGDAIKEVATSGINKNTWQNQQTIFSSSYNAFLLRG